MDLKISQLESYFSADVKAADLFAIVDMTNGETKKISYAELKQIMGGTPTGGLNGQVLYWNNTEAIWKTLTKSDVGLGNVNNTSDINKPVSTAQQGALDLKADKTELATKASIAQLNNGLVLKQDKLPNGTDGMVLTLEDGLPVWRPSGSSSSALYIPATIQNIANGGKITLAASANQVVKIKGASGVVTVNADLFSSVPAHGSQISIMGMDSDDYVIIEENDVDYGVILTDTFYATKYAQCNLFYDENLKRYFERGRVDRA